MSSEAALSAQGVSKAYLRYADPKDRLFDDHNVDRENGRWIRRDCGTDTVARQVEASFHKKGCDGGPGGGDSNTKYVYAYKITSTTVEAA